MALTKAQIVDTAYAIVRDHGLAGLSMRHLASELQVQAAQRSALGYRHIVLHEAAGQTRLLEVAAVEGFKKVTAVVAVKAGLVDQQSLEGRALEHPSWL